MRRLSRILPPYLLWSAAYLLTDAAFGKPHVHPLREILTGTAYMHLYYLFVLVQFVLLSGLLRYAVDRRPAMTFACSAVVSLALQGLLCLQAVGRLRLPALPVPLVLWFAPWLIFYVGGLWLRKTQAWRGLRLHVCLPLAAASAACVLLTAKRFPALRSLSLRPDLTVYAFAAWLLLWTLCGTLQTLPRAVAFVGRHSFGLYLTHPLFMRLWNEYAVRRNPVVYLNLWQRYLLTAAGGLVAAYLLSLLPFGKWLGGASRPAAAHLENKS